MTKFKINYLGSYFWLLFWAIFFFPLAIALLTTKSTIIYGDMLYGISYNGSRFWFCFWTVVFFPIALILLITQGFSVRKEVALLTN